MKKQLAVEWLVEQLKIEEGIDFIPTSIFNQAKALEKQHVMEFLEEYDSYIFRGGDMSEEQYYNYIYEN
jgi:hypothetical protein